MTGQNSSQELERIIHWQQRILRLTGVNFFDDDFKINFRTLITTVMAICFTTVHITDMYIFRDDIFNFTFVLITLCYTCIGWIRLINGLKDSKPISSLVVTAVETHRNASTGQRVQNILNSFVKLLKQAVVTYSVMFLGGCIMSAMLPIIVYLWSGEAILPFGIILPFVDSASQTGYIYNYIYQVLCIMYFPPQIATSQNMYFMLVFNICIEYELLMLKLAELDQMISNNSESNLNELIHDKLVEIVRCHQRINEFVSRFEELYSHQIFMEISCDALQIIVTLFVLHIEPWVPGYFVIVVATFQLFLYCLLGTLIDIKTDVLSECIYNVSWHKLPKKEQNIVQIMLQVSQSPRQLTYGGLVPLNMNLFQSIYRKIYSVFMMLQTSSE
ncbi:odorant receptor 67d-like [Wyeomyia smithii]|uniref:odorant receptor 67d-like n=1 Tax=Wyeomyia smithii TaxID=174621 RepID=UPI002467AFBD|nr:odorant receptor 67d-like [Wyeomyia smithii]